LVLFELHNKSGIDKIKQLRHTVSQDMKVT